MSKALEAADAIRRAAKQYESFVAAADILEQIGSLENAFGEGQKAVDAIRAEVEEAKTEIANLKANAVKVKAEQDNLLAAAKAAAAGIEDGARMRAEIIIREAGARASEVEKQAKAAGDVHLGYVSTEAAKLAEQRDALASEVAMLTERANLANEAADAAEKRLAKVKDTIVKLASA